MSVQSPTPAEEPALTEREEKIAQRAAQLAVEMMMKNFYQEIGKNVVSKFLIFVGVAFVGLVMVAKGIIPVKLP